jgi:hypothetical protein
MKIRMFSEILSLGVLVILSCKSVLAEEVIVNLKQPFIAGGTVFPAGHYRFVTDNDNAEFVNMMNLDRHADQQLRFETRLSPREGKVGSVVFDKVGDELYLAEIYIVGTDGYFFKGAPGKHKHLIVKESIE